MVYFLLRAAQKKIKKITQITQFKIHLVMIKSFIKPKSLLGIDVSQNAVRILELNKNGDTIETYALVPLFQNQADETSNIIATLKAALENSQSKTAAAIIALSYSAIIHKTITVPTSLNDREIAEFLALNLEKYISIPQAQISFDYQVAEKTPANTTIDLIAVRKERIEKCKNILAAVNLKPKIIDIDVFALARTLNTIYRPTQPIVAINLDCGAILTCALSENKILYAHEDFIDDAKLKMQFNEYLVQHLQMCTTTLQQPPTQLILSGEYAMKIEAETIAALTHLPTTILNPCANLKLAPQLDGAKIGSIAPALAIALGLALRRLDDV